MKSSVTASVFLASCVSVAASASAGTVALSNYTSTPAFPSDTRTSGSATDNTYSIDGTHSTVLLQTNSLTGVGSQQKVAPFFYSGTLLSVQGTLGDLGRGGLTADWLLQSRGANTPSYVGNIAAFRILVGLPQIAPTATAELIWEAPYQATVPTFVQGTNYDNVDIGSGQYYIRYNGTSYGDGSTNNIVNAQTLAQIANGASLAGGAPILNDTDPVYGLEVSIGSGAGDYSAYVGDINATFTSVPEPATLSLCILSATGLLTRRRRVV